jgi:hypothetical protein
MNNGLLSERFDTLSQAIQRIKGYLAYHSPDLSWSVQGINPALRDDDQASREGIPAQDWSPLQHLGQRLQLSQFAQDLLVLCAGVELDSEIAQWCRHHNPQQASVTFGLALAVLPEAQWESFTPTAPLRHWQLIDIGPGHHLVSSPLRINERILHYLTGSQFLDERLRPYVRMVEEVTPEQGALVPSHQALIERGIQAWRSSAQTLPLLQLCGLEAGDKHRIAHEICRHFGLDPCEVDAATLPSTPRELEELSRLWMREAILSHRVLWVNCDRISLDSGDPMGRQQATTLAQLLQRIRTPLMLSTQQPKDLKRDLSDRAIITLEVQSPTLAEQRQLWTHHLQDYGQVLNGQFDSQLDRLMGHFNLSGRAIQWACQQSLGVDPHNLFQTLWQTCRHQARQSTGHLIERIEATADWEDLIVSETAQQVLVDVAAHVRQRLRVYHEWGFAGKTSRGMGISALFAGASGTGKTMAAEILAKELNLDLYRVDLSGVVSKYIGETEKNLRQVFALAEAGGSILLFDEADALFGKRSDVKDSHDRYANMEVSYLLQQMESYRGLSILTTNLKDSIDTAFLRRIRFVVRFSFPDPTQRALIWQRIFPQQTPTQGLNFNRLASLQVSGGNIRNIALNAAFIAADTGDPVQMVHILQAARQEYVKLEKTLTDPEIKGWI